MFDLLYVRFNSFDLLFFIGEDIVIINFMIGKEKMKFIWLLVGVVFSVLVVCSEVLVEVLIEVLMLEVLKVDFVLVGKWIMEVDGGVMLDF